MSSLIHRQLNQLVQIMIFSQETLNQFFHHFLTIKVNYNPAETGNTYASKDGNQTITIRKLDDMNLPKIDYIKVDTEGFEIEVLKGGEKMIEEYKPFVHVEVKGKVLVKQGLSSDDVDEYLKSINYKEVFRISSERVYAHNKK